MTRHGDIQRLAERLMTEHGVGYLPFRFHTDGPWLLRAATQFVETDAGTMASGISMNLWWAEVMKPHDIRWTILHEIAHVKAGLEAAHGPLWAAECLRLGIEPVEKRRAQVSLSEKIYVKRMHEYRTGLDQSVSPARVGV